MSRPSPWPALAVGALLGLAPSLGADALASEELPVSEAVAPEPAQEPTAAVAAQATPADDTIDLGDGWRLDLGLSVQYRVAMSQVSTIQIGRPLLSDQSQLEPTVGFDDRLRLAGHAAFKYRTGFLREVRLDLAADLFSGPFSTSLEDDLLVYDPFQPSPDGLASRRAQHLRQASAEVTTLAGRVAGGRMTSTWGLGILAQGGADDPMQFGYKRTGHYVNRVSYTMMPSVWAMGDKGFVDAPFVIGFAYDWLVLDDRADERDGDSGNNIIAILGWFGKDLQVGAYGVRRTQKDDLGLETSAWVGDLYAHGVLEVDGWTLQAATEWAVISGETEQFRSYANPDTVDVLQVGGVVRFDLEKDWFIARLEGGYASGDSRIYDDTIHTMSFASDYHVGLALFPELLRRQTAVAAYNAQDPRFTGQPPVGFDETPSRGAFAGAMYLNPVLGLRPFEGLTLLTGAVLASSSEDYADIYQTALAGGTPTGPRGATHERDLGLELDVGVRYHQPIAAGVSAELRFDAGVLFPGAVFDDADGNAASALAVTAGQILLQGEW